MDANREALLWGEVRLAGCGGKTPREIAQAMLDRGLISSVKQAWATLEKWSDRGLYDFGVTGDLGWLWKDAEFYRWGEVHPATLMRLVEIVEAPASEAPAWNINRNTRRGWS